MSDGGKSKKREKTELCEFCGNKFSKQGIASHVKKCGGSHVNHESKQEVETVVKVSNVTEKKARVVSEWDHDFDSRPLVIFKRETASEKLMSNISEKLPEIIGMLSPFIAAAAESLTMRARGPAEEEATFDSSLPLPASQVVVPDEDPKTKKYYNFSNFP